MTDLHSHILPGIDNGAKTVKESLFLLHQEVEQGVNGITFTPHFDPEKDNEEDFLYNRQQSWQMLKEGMRTVPSLKGLKVRVGAEIYYNCDLPKMNLQPYCFSGTNCLLVDLPKQYLPQDLEKTIFQIRMKGYKVILSHVEQYPFLLEDLSLLYALVDAGCIVQVNSNTLLEKGTFRKQIFQLMDWNLIHVISSDAHHPKTSAPRLSEAAWELSRKLGKQKTKEVLCNAEQIFKGNNIIIPEPHKPKQGINGAWK